MENKEQQPNKATHGYWLTEYALQKNKFTWILLILSFIVGFWAVTKIPKEWSPDVKIPILIITTVYPGASPLDSELLITRPLEAEFQGIKGVNSIKSTSADSISAITIEFTLRTNLQDAKNQVRDAISKAKTNLPKEAQESLITEINFSELPFFSLNLASKLNPDEFKLISDDIKSDIEGIPGVLSVKTAGAIEKEMQVFVDPVRLNYYGISVQQIISAISRENINSPAGSVSIGSADIPVRLPGEKTKATDFANIIVSAPGQKPVYLKEVANTVTFGNKEETSISMLNGQKTITLSVSKRAGENLQRITEEIYHIIAKWEKTLDGNVTFSVLSDQNILVERNLDDLLNNLIIGFLLVVLILYVVMGFSNSILVATAIPLSMLMGIIFLNLIGTSLNMVVLFSLAMALGLVVDDAIVVVENVYRHLQMGRPIRDALRIGIGEIASPVIASTLTTLASFFPLLFVPGIVGDFMKYLPITLIATLLSSLFVALVFNPVMCNTWMRLPKKILHDSHHNEEESVRDSKVLQWYGRVISWCLDRSLLVIGANLALFVFVFILYFFILSPGVEFFPKDEPSDAYIDIAAPYGSNLDESKRLVADVYKIIQPYEKYASTVVTNIGVGTESRTPGTTPYLSNIAIHFPDWQKRTEKPSEVVKQIQADLDKPENQIPGAKISLNVTTSGPPAAKPVNLEVAGPDLTSLKKISNDIQSKISSLPGLINLSDDLDLTLNNITVTPDPQLMANYNLRNDDVGLALRTAINGTIASKYRLGKDQYDVVVRYPTSLRKSIDDIRHIPIATARGLVELQNVANIDLGIASGSIQHVNKERTVTVSADALGVSGANLLGEVKQALAGFELPQDYTLSYTGENERQDEVQSYMPIAFLMAVFLIYMIMVWEFGSISAPLIVLATVFLSLIGVLIGLSVHLAPFSIMMGGIGVVALAGIVVKNGIVLLDYIHYKRVQGIKLREAIILSGMLRVRPIILTAATAILALFPTLIGMNIDLFRWPNPVSFSADGGAIWKPLANAMVYGLLVSTTLTLVFVPCLYYVVESIRESRDNKKAAKAKLRR